MASKRAVCSTFWTLDDDIGFGAVRPEEVELETPDELVTPEDASEDFDNVRALQRPAPPLAEDDESKLAEICRLLL